MQQMLSRRSWLGGAVLLAAAAVLVAATVGMSAPRKTPPPSPLKTVLAQLKGLSPAAREAKLYSLAKAEGTLVWYTSLDTLLAKQIEEAFEAKYPGVAVNLVRAPSETLDARVLSEAAAGTPGADVIETNGPDMVIFQHKANILVPYRGSPYAAAVPARVRYDTFTGDRYNNYVVAWNTNLVPSGQEPKSWEELASTKWAGKISIEANDIDWYATLYQHLERERLAKLKPQPKTNKAITAAKAKVDRDLDRLFGAMVKNSQIVSGHTTQANLLAAGQFAVSVTTYAHYAEALQQKHAPVAFKPFLQPVLRREQGIGIAYRLQHPAAALLFYDWDLMKSGGQKALLDAGSAPTRPDMPDPQLQGARIVPIDLRTIVSHWGAWSKRWQNLIQR
jgi:iron(III) transport system substrate-binding protein